MKWNTGFLLVSPVGNTLPSTVKSKSCPAPPQVCLSVVFELVNMGLFLKGGPTSWLTWTRKTPNTWTFATRREGFSTVKPKRLSKSCLLIKKTLHILVSLALKNSHAFPLARSWVATCTASWPSRGSTGKSSAPGPSTWRTCDTTSITLAASRPKAASRCSRRRKRPPGAWPTWAAHRAWAARRMQTANGCPTRPSTDRGAPPTATSKKTSRVRAVRSDTHLGGTEARFTIQFKAPLQEKTPNFSWRLSHLPVTTSNTFSKQLCDSW